MNESKKNCKNEETTNLIYSARISNVSKSKLEHTKSEPDLSNVNSVKEDVCVEEEIEQENYEPNNSVVFKNLMFPNEEYDGSKKVDEEDCDGNSCSTDQTDGTDVLYSGSCSTLYHKLNFEKILAHPSLVSYKQTLESLPNKDASAIPNNLQSDSNSGWTSVCRICHGGESVANLFSPCNCRGSIAQTHLQCLERWLKESANSRCELCQYHFDIIRKPKYGIVRSIFVFLMHPGDHLRELLLDLFAFIIYTPATIATTYMLMLLCESISKSPSYQSRSSTIHIMTLAAVFGMAAIDFTYSSWLAANFQKHILAWRAWYRSHCEVNLVLPEEQTKSTHSVSLESEVD